MNDILHKSIVLVLNRNWQAINTTTPALAFCQMSTDVATGMDITSQEKKMIKTRLDIGKMLEESDFSLVVDLK